MTDPRNCRHKNIYWEDFFKSEKQNNNNYRHHNAYCLDCNTSKGRKFASKLQRWYYEKVKEWLKDNGLTDKFTNYKGEEVHSDFNFFSFLVKNNFEQQWNELMSGSIDPDYFEEFGGQMIFFEVAKSIEYLCQEFKKEKNKIPNKDPNRERANLLQYFLKNNIKSIKLSNNKLLIKYNHKEEEEDPNTPELQKIQDYIQNYSQNNSLSLSELQQTNSTTENSKQLLYWSLGIGGIVLISLLLIKLFFVKKPKRRIKKF